MTTTIFIAVVSNTSLLNTLKTMSNSIITLALLLIFLSASATWTGPIRLLTLQNYASVSCVYYDPASDITHVVVHERTVEWARHLAVSNNGTVLYSTLFRRQYTNWPKIVIRGAGDGKRLFMAMPYSFSDSDSILAFTESRDGGKTWNEPEDIVAKVKSLRGKLLVDLLYVAETGWVYVFFTKYQENELMVISRAAHSATFSTPKTIAKDINTKDTQQARASYNSWVGKLVLHVVYADNYNSQLKHLRSHDMGVTWQPAKEIAGVSRASHITGIASHPGSSQGIYVAYNNRDDKEMLIRSLDYGITYKPPLVLNKGGDFYNSGPSGLLLCGNKDPVLATLLVTTDNFHVNTTVEYTLWTQQRLEPYPRDYPKTRRPLSVGADCAVDANGGLDMFTVVSVEEKGGSAKEYAVYFAKETGKFPA